MSVLNREDDYLIIRNRGEFIVLSLCEIICIETNGRKLVFQTENARHSTYDKMKEVEEKLQLPRNFYMCHSRCIINFDKVSQVRDNKVYFNNGYRVTMSQRNFASTLQAFRGYLIGLTKPMVSKVK